MPKLSRSTSKSRPNLSRVFSVLFSGLGRLFLPLLLALPFVAVQADESDFSVRGFGTLGATRTNAQNAEFVRDLSQPRGVTDRWRAKTDSLLGVQASYQFNPQFEGVVQAVSRYRYDKTYNPDVPWAYLKYEPTPGVSLRAGRLGTEFFMLSDSRLVGYSYLTVRPPGDFFWHLPFYSIEGADAAFSLPLGEAVLRAKIFSGISHEKIALADEVWKLSGSRMSGAYLDYQIGSWLVRGSYSNIRFSNNLPIDNVLSLLGPGSKDAADFLATEKTRADYYSLGLVYDRGPWQFQLMLNKINQGSNAFQDSTAGYVLAGYRIASVTPFIGYSQVASQKRTNTLNPVIDGVMADSHAHQKTWMLGARWDIAKDIALKAQVDSIRGTPESIFPYRRENESWSGRVNVFSATLDFVF